MIQPEDYFDFIKSRRVARNFLDRPVPDDLLWSMLEAARWTPVASGHRIHRFVVITDPALIEQIDLLAPGMVLGHPPAAQILICIDWAEAGYTPDDDYVLAYYDVGKAAMSMQLAAHALGLATGPFTGFSPSGIAELLNLPESWSPEMFLNVGYRDDTPTTTWRIPKVKVDMRDYVQWGAFPAED
jgi:nitroreductase